MYLPFSDSSGHIGANYRGKLRVITIQGAHDAAEYNGATQDLKLRDFIETVEDWVNSSGSQPSQIYNDSYGRTFSVKCIDWTYRRSRVDPNRLLYTFILREVA